MAAIADNSEGNPAPEHPEESLTEENRRALHLVQALVSDTLRLAISSATQEILQVVDQGLAAQAATTNNPASDGALTICSGGGGVASMPNGQLPLTGASSGIPVVSSVPVLASSSSLGPVMSLGNPAALGSNTGLLPTNPLSSLLPPPADLSSSEALFIGALSPPVPRKLAEKIWKGEFFDLSKLLPSRLGAPELIVKDLISSKERPKEQKKIATIQQWVVCFNTFISVMAIKHPGRVQDLLGYTSMITKS